MFAEFRAIDSHGNSYICPVERKWAVNFTFSNFITVFIEEKYSSQCAFRNIDDNQTICLIWFEMIYVMLE